MTEEHDEDLAAEERVLRKELPDVQIPVGLEARLMDLPEAPAGAREGNAPAKPRPWGWLTAAAILVVASLAFVFNNGGGDPGHSDERGVDEVARLATANHLHDHHLTVETSDAGTLERELSGALPFAVTVPALDGGLDLRGGRKCALGTSPVAYSSWSGTAGDCALYQFEATSLGVVPSMDPVELVVNGLPGQDRPVKVRVWSEEGRGYALVSPTVK